LPHRAASPGSLPRTPRSLAAADRGHSPRSSQPASQPRDGRHAGLRGDRRNQSLRLMLRSVVIFLRRVRRRFQTGWWRWLLLNGHSGTLATAGKLRLDVPVSANGQGRVEIADRVRLGYALAPKVGGGDILLQAR